MRLAAASLAVITSLCGCTHTLGDSNKARLSADARALCHVYRDFPVVDGGNFDRALVKSVYDDETKMLGESGVVIDGGTAGCEGQ